VRTPARDRPRTRGRSPPTWSSRLLKAGRNRIDWDARLDGHDAAPGASPGVPRPTSARRYALGLTVTTADGQLQVAHGSVRIRPPS
jgi:hypothetical protein